MTKSNCAFDAFVESLKEDYDWIYGALNQVYHIDNDEDEKHFHDAIILGDLPRLPPNYIERTNMVSCNALLLLQY